MTVRSFEPRSKKAVVPLVRQSQKKDIGQNLCYLPGVRCYLRAKWQLLCQFIFMKISFHDH